MRRFRRRRPRVAWLPTFGFSREVEGANPTAGYVGERTTVNPQGDIQVDAFPLTWDGTESPETTQSLGLGSFTLADFVNGQAYRLRRVVGNLVITTNEHWITGVDTYVATDVHIVDVAAGLMVYRTKQDQTVDTDTLLAHHPLKQDAMDDPWIWRRRWQLATGRAVSGFARPGPAPASGTETEPRFGSLPRNNLWGSVAEGSKVDQKTARVISNEERLYLVVAAKCITRAAGSTNHSAAIGIDFDYRLLASLRMNQGNRRNASR